MRLFDVLRLDIVLQVKLYVEMAKVKIITFPILLNDKKVFGGYMGASNLDEPSIYYTFSSTSDVTHRLNSLALGNLLERMRLYKPDSLMMVISCAPPRVSHFVTPLSSSSTWSLRALRVLLYPRISATSFPTNHGSLLMLSVRMVLHKPLLLIKIVSQFWPDRTIRSPSYFLYEFDLLHWFDAVNWRLSLSSESM